MSDPKQAVQMTGRKDIKVLHCEPEAAEKRRYFDGATRRLTRAMVANKVSIRMARMAARGLSGLWFTALNVERHVVVFDSEE